MPTLLKVYTWASGIIVAFLASYLTGVLTAVIPPPKDLLCELSIGFCPPPKIIEFNATDIDVINDRKDVGQGPGEFQIGMLHNRVVPDNADRPNMVKYKFATDVPGEFHLRILYASPDQRPVELFINDTLVANDALEHATGGGNNDDRKWSKAYAVRLQTGFNTLMLKRPYAFPHLSKFELAEIRH